MIKATGGVTEDAGEMKSVRKMQELRVAGRGYHKIARALTKPPVPSKGSGPWHTYTIRYVALNPLLADTAQTGVGAVRAGQVTEANWESWLSSSRANAESRGPAWNMERWNALCAEAETATGSHNRQMLGDKDKQWISDGYSGITRSSASYATPSRGCRRWSTFASKPLRLVS